MTKISDLSDGGALQSTDELIVVRSGGNARAKMNTLPDMTVSQSPSVPSSSAQIFYNSTKGAVLRGQGSTSDVTIENDAGQTALTVGTGTQSVGIGGTASASYTLDVIKAGAIATRARSTDDSDVSQFFYSQGTTATQNIYFGDSANTAAAGLRYFHSTDNLTFTGKGAGSEMARFNSSGYFSVGGSVKIKTNTST